MPTSPSLENDLQALLEQSKLAPLRTQSEQLLFTALLAGAEIDVDCCPENLDDNLDARNPKGWQVQQEIRGALVRWACLQLLARGNAAAASLSIRGARFVREAVDLSGFLNPIAIEFNSCRFEIDPDFSETHFASLHLERTWAKSLFAKAIVIDKELNMSGFASQNKVSLERAKIGGDLDLSKNQSKGSDKTLPSLLGASVSDCDSSKDEECNLILDWQNIQVGGSIYLDGCAVWGLIDMTGAQIGSDLDFGAAHLNGLGNASVVLEKVLISGQVFFEEGFTSTGAVLMDYVTIKDGISANGGTFRAVKSPALRIENSHVSGECYFSGLQTSCDIDGVSFKDSELDKLTFLARVGSFELDLRNAKVVQYVDLHKNWPAKIGLHVDGFVYSRIAFQVSENRTEVYPDVRSKWLELDTEDSSQSYVQLAKVMQEEGYEPEAIGILENLASRRFHRRGFWSGAAGSSVSWIGYGYQPARAGWALMGLTGLGWIIYRRAYIAGRITPTEKDAYADYKNKRLLPSHYPKFSPMIYSLENTFPLVNLGQASKWQPDPSQSVENAEPGQTATPEIHGNHQPPDKPASKVGSLLTRGVDSIPVRVFLWFQILLGWVLATLIVAGITGLLHR